MTAIQLLILVVATLSENLVVYSQGLNQNVLRMVSSLDDKNHLDMAIREILRPRVVNTTGHEYVKSFIVSELESMGFAVELDAFRNTTPYGDLEFTNVVGRLNPQADKFLTFACHYDSKLFDFEFVAATDSAVPCAIMLNLAKTLLPSITAGQRKTTSSQEVSLMLIFFDGEEAFLDWKASDSLYGSRHLARLWENKFATNSLGKRISELERIELLVLLDLIGGKGSRYYSLFSNTNSQFRQLYGIEKALGRLGELKTNNYQFQRRQLDNAQIEDDHVPFMVRGVPIMHLISLPFPEHWHKAGDNYQNLDYAAIESFADILRAYTYNYLMGLTKS